MKLIIWGMTATVVNDVVTLVPGDGESLPAHLGLTSAVLTTITNPANAEWQPSTTGKKYRLTIETES